MYAPIFLGVIVVVLFGMVLLALTMGFKEIEEKRRKQAEEVRQSRYVLAPHFFGPQHVASTTASGSVGKGGATEAENVDLDAVVIQVEEFLGREETLAQRFVDEPSVDNLYGKVRMTSWTK